ncbi:MAG: NADH-quinone oxidoreductase subunit K [Chloroflexota bacterium]|nr:NADH-quinone oxidoreductase subunit K [Chloroflexota bacterium]
MNGGPVQLQDVLFLSVSAVLFLLGLGCLLTQREAIKQVIGLKIMLQGVTLGLVYQGHVSGDLHTVQSMVISALVVETILIAVALALIINVYEYYPSGDIDELDRLRG